MTHHKVTRHASFASKTQAQKEAEKLRKRYNSNEHKVRVRHDPVTGRWVVEVISLVVFAGLALGLLGALHR